MSRAFAMVDHQVAHVFVKPGEEKAARKALESTDGIEWLLDTTGKKHHGVDHERSGDFIAVSARDRWFSYYWWEDRVREPDFATQVDIHRKPGYDPLELFAEPGTFKISQDTALIRGSHGYPPSGAQDDAVLLVSGRASQTLEVPESPSVTDFARIIEEFFLG